MLDIALKARFVQELDARRCGVWAASREVGIDRYTLSGWLKRPRARLWRRTLKKVARWLGISVEEAAELQGGFYLPPIVKARRRNKTLQAEVGRKVGLKLSVLKAGNIPIHMFTPKARVNRLRGLRRQPRRSLAFKVQIGLISLRRYHREMTDEEIEVRAVENLIRRGMDPRGAKGLVRQVMSKSRGGRPARLDWDDVYTRRLAGETDKQIATQYGDNTSAKAINEGLRRYIKKGRHLTRKTSA